MLSKKNHEKKTNYTFSLFGHPILTKYEHELISFSLDECCYHKEAERLYAKKITTETLKDCEKAPYSKKRMRQYLEKQANVVDGFVFYSRETNEPVGCFFVMYRGGNELQYRIRSVDAFGFDLCVYEAFRGKGYAHEILYDTLCYLRDKKGIDRLYAGVRTNNDSALRSYEKFGYRAEGRKSFAHFLYFKLPYPKI